MESVWQIRLLGGLRAERGAEVVTRFRSQKIAALLAYLALFPHRSPSREELADLFWPDADPDAARGNLRTALSSLRRQFEAPDMPAGAVLRIDGRQTVGINCEGVRTDVGTFETAVRAAGRGNTSPDERVRLLSEAVSVYGGPLLPGFYETWVLAERDRLAEAHWKALNQLVICHEQNGDLETALSFARRAVSADPLREDSHSAVIRLLMATGQATAARRQFIELARVMSEEFGEEPSPTVKALLSVRSSVVSSPVAVVRPSPPLPSQVAAAFGANTGDELGEATPSPKIADELGEPEPSRTVPRSVPAPVRLPLTLSRFFGREDEIAAIDAALCRPEETRLVTLSGPGGAGKTRLALEAARRSAGAFPGGVFFVPLADLRDTERFFEVIAGVLGILPAAVASNSAAAREQVIAGLCDRPRTLLLLDNFEQLVETGAGCVRMLLDSVPHLSCLVTSRQLLLIEGEREIVVAPLPTPAHQGTPERLAEFASVELFVDRARATRPDFQINARNAASVALLCARLEGIPLAIELAAAWAQTLTPAQMLDRLDKPFDLLVSRRRDVPGRHATLRAAIEWSYRLLSPELAAFFMKLSVFRGGWTLEAAEAVTGEPNAIEFLTELKERSLLVTEETMSETAMRFRMLETLREFATDQMELAPDGLAQKLRRQHASYFADFAERAERELHGAEATAALDRLESDHGNFRAALEWVIGEPAGTDASVIGMQLAGALHRFWFIRGHLGEGRRWLQAVLAAASDEMTSVRAIALSAAAGLAEADGEHEFAGELHSEALRVHQACGDGRGVAYSLCQLGLVAAARGDHEQARSLFEESLVACEQVGDEGNRAHVLKCLGVNAIGRGEMESAQPLFRESLSMYRRFGDKRGIAMVLGELAQLELTTADNLDRATEYLEEHLALARQLRDVVHTADALSRLGMVAQQQGDFELARARFGESLDLFRDSGYSAQIVFILDTFAGLALAENEPERGVRLQAAAEAMRDRCGPPRTAEDRRHIQDEWRGTVGSEVFEECWAEGQKLSVREAILYARAGLSAAVPFA